MGRMINQTVSYFNSYDTSTLLKKGYQENNHTYAVVNRLTRTAARIKITLFSANHKEITQLFDHPALKLINRPNPRQGRREFMEELHGWKFTTGEAFVHMLWPDMGINAKKPKELHIIPSVWVSKINIDNLGGIVSYEIGWGMDKQTIPANEMIHLKYWNPDGGLRGMSPLTAAAKSIQTSNDAYTSNMRSLQNGGPAGILSGVNDGHPLSVADQELVQQKYSEKYGGAENRGKIIVTGATLSWQAIGLSPVDLDIIKQNNWSLRDICNVYGVSSRLFNDPESNNGSTQKEVRIDLVVNAVNPEMETNLDEFDRAILTKFEKGNETLSYKTDLTDFQELKEDEAAITTALAAQWWTTGNEKRERQGLDKSDKTEMDNVYIPAGTVPIDEDLDFGGE